jgi:hypothetical protein
MNIQNDGGPAFPTPAGIQHNDGMTLRQYAAINLRVPDSGLPWLDKMIVQSRSAHINDAMVATLKASDAILQNKESK